MSVIRAQDVSDRHLSTKKPLSSSRFVGFDCKVFPLRLRVSLAGNKCVNIERL